MTKPLSPPEAQDQHHLSLNERVTHDVVHIVNGLLARQAYSTDIFIPFDTVYKCLRGLGYSHSEIFCGSWIEMIPQAYTAQGWSYVEATEPPAMSGWKFRP